MKNRKPDYPISDIFINRRSTYALSGQLVTDNELMSLFEAARWAPSSHDNQPWRFLYAKKDSRYWDIFFNLLVPANQEWAKNASVLIVIVSHNNFEFNNKPSRTHSFDAGSAWENLALQGSINGLVVHAVEGFDYNKARSDLQIPDDYTVEAMVAVGRPAADPSAILSPKLHARDAEPTDRKPVQDIVIEGLFKKTS
jgi:nitroreductase